MTTNENGVKRVVARAMPPARTAKSPFVLRAARFQEAWMQALRRIRTRERTETGGWIVVTEEEGVDQVVVVFAMSETMTTPGPHKYEK